MESISSTTLTSYMHALFLISVACSDVPPARLAFRSIPNFAIMHHAHALASVQPVDRNLRMPGHSHPVTQTPIRHNSKPMKPRVPPDKLRLNRPFSLSSPMSCPLLRLPMYFAGVQAYLLLCVVGSLQSRGSSTIRHHISSSSRAWMFYSRMPSPHWSGCNRTTLLHWCFASPRQSWRHR